MQKTFSASLWYGYSEEKEHLEQSLTLLSRMDIPSSQYRITRIAIGNHSMAQRWLVLHINAVKCAGTSLGDAG